MVGCPGAISVEEYRLAYANEPNRARSSASSHPTPAGCSAALTRIWIARRSLSHTFDTAIQSCVFRPLAPRDGEGSVGVTRTTVVSPDAVAPPAGPPPPVQLPAQPPAQQASSSCSVRVLLQTATTNVILCPEMWHRSGRRRCVLRCLRHGCCSCRADLLGPYSSHIAPHSLSAV